MSRSVLLTSNNFGLIRSPCISPDRLSRGSRSQSPYSIPASGYMDYGDVNYSRMSSSRFSSRATTPDRPPSRHRPPSSPMMPPTTAHLRHRYDIVHGTSTPPRSRSPSPFNAASELIMKKSRQQRLNSIPPPPPPPQFASRPPLGSTAARVVASDFYRGKVKSIYEREPLWQEFSTSVSGKGYSMYNSEHLTHIKNDFKNLVEDKYRRVKCNDPSVGRETGAKLFAWNNILHKPSVPASQALGEKHSARKREPSPAIPLPKIRLYHKSTRAC